MGYKCFEAGGNLSSSEKLGGVGVYREIHSQRRGRKAGGTEKILTILYTARPPNWHLLIVRESHNAGVNLTCQRRDFAFDQARIMDNLQITVEVRKIGPNIDVTVSFKFTIEHFAIE
jgi:hypothetical protein